MVVSQNWQREVDTVHTSRSSNLFYVEASLARVFQSVLKTDGGMIGVMHVTLSQRLCRSQVKDRRVNATCCVRPCYPCFAVFILLAPWGIVII
jgi:hypothetical protein